MERSAGIVVFHDNKYLLLHYEAGHWDFPKGHVEKDESDEQAALREVEEEAGIGADIIPGFEEKIGYFYKREGKLIRKEVVFFVGKAKSSTVKLSYEHIGFEWLPFKEAINQLTYKNAKEVLSKADAFLKNHGQ
ncbi:NUDIX domain-containing protein [Candidatus Woesearchaeota archaeon]|nr:NUDIX domain-containing protein [Candidatus Woesearchaeota archaeon]